MNRIKQKIDDILKKGYQKQNAEAIEDAKKVELNILAIGYDQGHHGVYDPRGWEICVGTEKVAFLVANYDSYHFEKTGLTKAQILEKFRFESDEAKKLFEHATRNCKNNEMFSTGLNALANGYRISGREWEYIKHLQSGKPIKKESVLSMVSPSKVSTKKLGGINHKATLGSIVDGLSK